MDYIKIFIAVLMILISGITSAQNFKNHKWKNRLVLILVDKTDNQPEIILIGLDGEIKLRANEFLSSQELFEAIDAMPMRMQEMRRKKTMPG